jgi:dihydroorotase
MSKFLMLGMSITEVVASVTTRAAAAVSAFKDRGTLRKGAPADIAILELRDGEFDFVDNVDATRTGRRKLFTTAVVLGGMPVR